jgi:hypothetical protein
MLTGIKDLDLLIIEYLDDKDILNCSLVNKYFHKICNSKILWNKRLLKYYKKYQMNIPNPKKHYFYIKKYFNNQLHDTLCKLSQQGEKDVLYYFLKFLEKDDDIYIEYLEDCMYHASVSNHFDIIQFCIQEGANDFDSCMSGAAIGNHIDLIEYYIKKGANDWNYGLYGAIESKNTELIQFFLDKGADDFEYLKRNFNI